jgi:hypothetical protein
MNRSASVDLPWSMCAMIEKLRTFCMGKMKGHPAVPSLTARQTRTGRGRRRGRSWNVEF